MKKVIERGRGMVTVKEKICIACTVAISVVLLIPLWVSLVMAVMQLFTGGIQMLEAFPLLLKNTAVTGAISIVIGSVYVFVASIAIGGIKKNPLKGIVASLFAVPAIVPVNLIIKLFPLSFLSEPSFFLQLLAGTQKGLRLAGVVLIAALFIKRNLFREASGVTKLYVVIGLCGILCSELTFITDIYNPLTYKVLDSFSSFIYRKGLVNSDFSFGAILYMARFFVGAAGAACAYFLFNRIMDEKIQEEREKTFLPVHFLSVFPVAFLLVLVIKGSSCLPQFSGEDAVEGYLCGILLSGISAVLVSVISLVLSALVKNSGKTGAIALIITLLAGDNIVGEYTMLKGLDIANNHLGVLCHSARLIPLLTVIFMYINREKGGVSKGVAMFFSGTALAFCLLWGDSFFSGLILNNSNDWPISVMVKESLLYYSDNTARLSTLAYILIPVWIGVAGVSSAAALAGKSKTEKIYEE